MDLCDIFSNQNYCFVFNIKVNYFADNRISNHKSISETKLVWDGNIDG